MNSLSPPYGHCADFRQANIAYVPLLDEISDGADRLFDWHAGIKARRTIDVDVFDTESLQRIGDKIPYRCGSRIVAVELTRIRSAECSEFDADLYLVPVPPLQSFTHQHLVMAHSVEVTSVEQRHPLIESRMD